MKRSKPSIVVGGGEMKRETSSVVNIANNDCASVIRSSRSVTPLLLSTGRPARQSVVMTSSVGGKTTCSSRSARYGIFSIRGPPSEESAESPVVRGLVLALALVPELARAPVPGPDQTLDRRWERV